MKISISNLYQSFLACKGVSTDTRKIDQDVLFFALKGPNFDANSFAQQALEKGAKYVVIDNPEYQLDERYLLVDNALKALQDLATYHRQQLDIPVVGLTGSNGKTTTKELIYTVLSQHLKTYATQGNLNNHIGVPLTILGIDHSFEIAIVEMGANKPGDIRELVEICQPTHGLITNVGKAHLEGFRSLEGVKRTKGELYDWLATTNGTVFINAKNPILMDMAQYRNFAKKVYISSSKQPNTFIIPTLLESIPFVKYQTPDNHIVVTHLTGGYNFENIAIALAIGEHFGIPTQKAHQGIASYSPTNNRSQVVIQGTNTILMDAYNANPSSMTAAIKNFDQMPANKKMVILGDMFELGQEADSEHATLGELLAKCRFNNVLLIGELMQNALIHLPKAYYFPDKFGLHLWLQDHPQQDTFVLVKGSRGMGLESVLKFL
jgi:UDP-N-acetylmuramoyl-tripeptide--D-alanyl-D-alanine ligase